MGEKLVIDVCSFIHFYRYSSTLRTNNIRANETKNTTKSVDPIFNITSLNNNNVCFNKIAATGF